MWKVKRMAGTSQELYKCVAPLVMNPEILKYNHNYPFKTNESFSWFVAFRQGKVVGFFPVEVRKKAIVINNYYVEKDDESVVRRVLAAGIDEFKDTDKTLEAVVQKVHESFFSVQKFEVEPTWTTNLKMSTKNEKD